MEASVVEREQETPEEGAPSENGAEATRTTAHLFQYSRHVHVGAGAEECEQRDKCQDPAHFHAWICLPNAIQRQDILDKAKAAKARRKRALRDPEMDAYAILEGDLDDLMAQDREPLIKELAEREVNSSARERVIDLIEEEDSKYANYWQDREEYERLLALPEEERPTEEFESLKALIDEFEATLDRQSGELTEREVEHLKGRPEDQIREKMRVVRIEGDTSTTHLRTYYLWMGFICTKTSAAMGATKRRFEKLDDYRNAPPEVVEAVEETLRDLEGRFARGEAAGN